MRTRMNKSMLRGKRVRAGTTRKGMSERKA